MSREAVFAPSPTPLPEEPTPTPAGWVDLTSCEREPVHTPGAIQPHGVLVVLDPGDQPGDLRVVAASRTLPRVAGCTPEAVLGRPLHAVPVLGSLAGLTDLLRHDAVEEHQPIRLVLPDGGCWVAMAHRHAGRLILELEPPSTLAEFAAPRLPHFASQVHAGLVELHAAGSVDDLCARAARMMRRLTGFDRVMIYAFHPDGSGEVRAEECGDQVPRFLGLRFPSSDIPRQARALYAVCRLRSIPSAHYLPAELVALDDGRPIDLSHAALRAVSPVHLEFMHNMGVTASLGVSLLRDGALWGLITCNHESGERYLPAEVRTACALAGEIISSLIAGREQRRESEQREGALATHEHLVRRIARDKDLVSGLTASEPSLLDVARSPGAAIYHRGVVHRIGATPPLAAIHEVLAWLRRSGGAPVATDSLPSLLPAAEDWKDRGCGLVAVPVRTDDSGVVREESWLLWFRPEAAVGVSWGGDPRKVQGASDRISPRTSFEAWKEEVRLRAEPFSPAEIAAAHSLAAALTDVVLGLEAGRRLQEDAQLLQESYRRLREQLAEQQRVELELRRAQRMEAIGKLAAGLAHEVNTPLQYAGDSLTFLDEATFALLAHASRARDAGLGGGSQGGFDFDYLARQVPEAIDAAREGLERVSRIIRALKAFAHPDGADKLHADLNEALTSVVEVARAETREVADVALELGPLPPLPCYLGELNQVFLDLIVNAAQAIAPTLCGARTRGVITVRSWPEAGSVFVSVTDDGTGIPEALREKIFLPFFTTREVGRGMGQGLAICHQVVVHRHGGSLTFESEVGRGTTFTVRLPV